MIQNKKSNPKGDTTNSVIYPLTLVIITVLVNLIFQTNQVLQEKTSLSLIKHNQNKTLEESRKLRTQFNTIVSETARLANEGNQNARLIISQLKQKGIKVSP